MSIILEANDRSGEQQTYPYRPAPPYFGYVGSLPRVKQINNAHILTESLPPDVDITHFVHSGETCTKLRRDVITLKRLVVNDTDRRLILVSTETNEVGKPYYTVLKYVQVQNVQQLQLEAPMVLGEKRRSCSLRVL